MTSRPEDQASMERELIAAIGVCLAAGGKEIPDITPDTIPLKGIGGFDSLCAIEVIVDIQTKFQIELQPDVFIEGSGKNARPRSVSAIASAILTTAVDVKDGGDERA